MASGYASHNAGYRGEPVASFWFQAIGWIALAVLVGVGLAILGNWRLWDPLPTTLAWSEVLPLIVGSAWFILLTAFVLGALVRNVGLAFATGTSLLVSYELARQWDGERRWFLESTMTPEQFWSAFPDAMLLPGLSVPLVLMGLVFAAAGSLWRTQPSPLRELALLPPVAMLLIIGLLNVTVRFGWYSTETGVLQLVLAGLLLLLSLRSVVTVALTALAVLATGAALLVTLLMARMVFGYGYGWVPEQPWQVVGRVGQLLGF